jgi:2-iminoacetate synthase ThiH
VNRGIPFSLDFLLCVCINFCTYCAFALSEDYFQQYMSSFLKKSKSGSIVLESFEFQVSQKFLYFGEKRLLVIRCGSWILRKVCDFSDGART